MQQRSVFLFLRGLVSAILIIYLVGRMDWGRLGDLLSGTVKMFLLLAPLLAMVALFLSAWRWKVLLTALHLRPPFKLLFEGYLIGSFFNIFLPGVIGGDLIRIGTSFRKMNGSLQLVATSVLIERFCGLIVLCVLGALAFFELPPDFVSLMGAHQVNTLAWGMLFGSAGGFGLYAVGRYLFGGRHQRAEGKRRPMAIREIALRLFQVPNKIFLVILLLSAAAQSLDIFTCFMLARALKISVPLLLFFGFIPIAYVVTILPISLGGLGVREGIMVFFLTQVGVSAAEAITLSFLIYFNNLAIALLGSIAYMIRKDQRMKKPDALMKSSS